jgi:hypothetical protein
MEGLGVAANIIAVVELSAKVASLCLDYSIAVKDAKKDITHLQTKVKELEEVAKDVQQLIDGPRGGKLSTSQKLEQAVLGCYTQLKAVEKRLDPGKGRKAMSRIGLRALKWPFESKEVDKIIRDLENCNATISLALQVDQT